MPSISGSVANVEVKAGNVTLTLKPIDVIKASGTWKEVASFPGEGRMHMVNFATSSDGYVYGGARFNSFDYITYNELYKFDPEANAWSKVSSNNAFMQEQSQAYTDGRLFLTGTTYGIPDNIFSPISFIKKREFSLMSATRYFVNNGIVYAISGVDSKLMEVQKYNTASDTWEVVTEVNYNPQQAFSFSFTVEYKGKVYIGVHPLTSVVTELWAFDGVSNSLTKVSSVSNDIEGNARELKYLFTLNELAYFVDRGEFSIDGSAKGMILKPRDNFYIYNFAVNEWRKVQAAFPSALFGVASMNIGNRGFVGIGTSADANTGVVYAQQFFEFIPSK